MNLNVSLDWEFQRILILDGLYRVERERTVHSLYYVLKGRKANQTLQDLHLFGLHPYYRMEPSLSKENWIKILSRLEGEGLLVLSKDRDRQRIMAVLTEEGRRVHAEGTRTYEWQEWFPALGNPTERQEAEEFSQSLHLMVQTISHLIAGDMNFFPHVGEKRIQWRVKSLLRGAENRREWTVGLQQELERLLTPLPVLMQRLFVEPLSGWGLVGQTYKQISWSLGLPVLYIRFRRLALLVDVIRFLRSRAHEFPLLSSLLPQHEVSVLSESVRKTKGMLRRGMTLEEIAQARGLRLGTIEDHLVEIVFHHPEWPVDDVLPPALEENIIRAARELGTRRLRHIKDKLKGDVNYLQIRLALARKGRECT